MLRKFAGAALVMFLVAGTLMAGEYRGILVSINHDGKMIGMIVKGESKILMYKDDTKFNLGDKGAPLAARDVKISRPGIYLTPVTVTTEGEGVNEVITQIARDRDKLKVAPALRGRRR
jgi:hypothetical protein